MDLNLNLERIINSKNYGKCVLLTFIYMLTGLLFFSVFLIIADQIQKKSLLYYSLQNIGIIFFFISLMISYSGVHRLNSSSINSNIPIKEIVIKTASASHLVFLTAICIILSLCMITAVELGISMIAEIPYAGPIIIMLLTAPLFLINFLCLLISLSAFFIIPPLVTEENNFATIIKKFFGMIRTNGLSILLYIIISLVLLYLCLKIIYYITGYSAGITKAIQWKINITYPNLMNNFILKSFLTDIVEKISPQPDSLMALKRYGTSLFDYLNVIKYFTGFSFYISFAFIFSFPITAFFLLLSNFYKKIRL